MTISGIAWDTWAHGNRFVYTTIVMASIFFFISFTLFLIRICQVCRQNQEEAVEFPEKLLQTCHLGAMFFSSFYMFLYIWNYLHVYSDCNEMNCTVWFVLIMTSITLTKVFIYSFLMLRSTLSFRNSFFEIPFKTSISITLISCISQLTWCALMLADFTAFSYSGSLCFRILGPIGTLGIVGFNINDAISAIVALIIFWIKAKSVKTMFFGLGGKKTGDKKHKQSNSNAKSDLEITEKELTNVFNKHIKLGMLIVIGSILIFLAGEFLTILMGVASCLHQCLNNIYLFLLFKENNNLYNIFCKCKNKKCFKQSNINELAHHLNMNNKTAEIKVNACNDVQLDLSEGARTVCLPEDNTVLDALSQLTDVHDHYIPSFHVNTPSFLSKSLSSIPRFRCTQLKKNIKSMSSHNLKAPVHGIHVSVSNLKLMDAPTLTATPTAIDKKMKNFTHKTFSTPMFPLTPTNDNIYVQQKGTHYLTTTPANLSSIELPRFNSANKLSVLFD